VRRAVGALRWDRWNDGDHEGEGDMATGRWDLEARASWTQEEWDWFCMGPFDGEIPGLVRRVRRILDVSQRGLAALLEVSQSVVARWETGRTSPRARVVQHLLSMAGLRARVHDEETGEEVVPMRNDGCRDRRGRRHPAHVDLRVIGWWWPRGTESTADQLLWQQRSRARRDPFIRYRTDRHNRRLERWLFGTPDDHPSIRQLAAEAEHLDELREQRREELRERARRRLRGGADAA
jgi:HTH-type transcriptional regulator/antitoxin HipB